MTMDELSSRQVFDAIDENYREICFNIARAAIKSGRTPEDITFMAVTKTVQPMFINHALSLGINLIGENKVQELLSKQEYLIPATVEKHIIGHLQTNKVRKIISEVSMIESLDSLTLAKEISLRTQGAGIDMDVLLEVNIGSEESKTGFDFHAVTESAEEISQMQGIRLRGLMAVPPICESETEVRRYFEKMNLKFQDMKGRFGDEFNVLSLGMSSDYVPAILEGSTLVRVGSALFGARRY